MKAANVAAFRKTRACPSSKTLLSFGAAKLSIKLSKLVRNHLSECDFCHAESMLLTNHICQPKRTAKVPELPINLRILAESILSQSKKTGKGPGHGLRLSE